jgi:uncharacterized protein YbcI
MDDEGDLKQQVSDVVARFEREVMAIRPGSVAVDLHPCAAVVTMHGIGSQAERDYAKESPGKELLERLYSETFNVVRGELEALLERVLGRKVRRSILTLDPETGDGVILIAFADGPSATGGEPQEGRTDA